MLVLGLTGGIGSGKSTIAKIFQSFGVPIYNSDDRAKNILFSDKEVHDALREEFGSSIFTNDLPDREKLAQLVFTNENKLKALNAIIHPRVAEDFEQWKNQQKSKIVLKEAAILIESGACKSVDKIVVVSAPEDIRIQRVMHRDNVSKEDVIVRMKNQFSEEERLKYADFIVDNSGNQHLISQVEKIIKELM